MTTKKEEPRKTVEPKVDIPKVNQKVAEVKEETSAEKKKTELTKVVTVTNLPKDPIGDTEPSGEQGPGKLTGLEELESKTEETKSKKPDTKKKSGRTHVGGIEA